MNNYQDLNTFQEGQTVNISDLEDYQEVIINRISDSGVTVSGKKCGNNIILSGKSPAQLSEIQREVKIKDGEGNIRPTYVAAKSGPEITSDTGLTPSGRVHRGTHTAKMSNLAIPEGNFTIKYFAEFNKIPIPYALKWVKDNCVEAGKAEKPEGQRGRVATLYTFVGETPAPTE